MRFQFPLRPRLIVPAMLSLSLFALAGCDALFTAPNAGDQTKKTQEQETPDVTDETKPTTTFMYVLNNLGETIDEINLKTMGVTLNMMETGAVPNQFVTQGVVTYVVQSFDNNLVKLDLRARKTLDTFDLTNGANPTTLGLFGSGKGLITNFVAKTLSFVDLADKTIEGSLAIPEGKPSNAPAIVGDKAYVPVDSWDDDWNVVYSAIQVVNLSSRTILKTIALDADANPGPMSVDPSGKLWVGVKKGLVMIDPATDLPVSLDFGAQVSHVQFLSASKAYAFVSGGLVSFDPSTRTILRGVSEKIALDSSYGAFKIFDGVGYVTDFGNDTVTVVDLVTEAASGSPIPVGYGPLDLTFVTVQDQ